MSNKFDPILAQIQTNFDAVKGEIYNFLNNNKKKSAAIARKCFLAIRKACNIGRAELQAMKSVLPVRRRNVSEETKLKMSQARAAKKSAKAPAAKVSVEKK